jgi:hypothetical protein
MKNNDMIDINESKALIFEEEDGTFSLSPRGCFACALTDTDIVDEKDASELNEDRKFDIAFKVLVKRFIEAGWITYGEEPAGGGTAEDQRETFNNVILGFYKDVTDAQVNAAFDEFCILLERHGNVKK